MMFITKAILHIDSKNTKKERGIHSKPVKKRQTETPLYLRVLAALNKPGDREHD